MVDYRVEDDGTEWGQSEDGVWYYREVESDNWSYDRCSFLVENG